MKNILWAAVTALVLSVGAAAQAQNVDDKMAEELAELQNILAGRPSLQELPAEQREAMILQFRQDLRGMPPEQRASYINEQRQRLQQLSPAQRDMFVLRRQGAMGQGTTNRAKAMRERGQDARTMQDQQGQRGSGVRGTDRQNMRQGGRQNNRQNNRQNDRQERRGNR